MSFGEAIEICQPLAGDGMKLHRLDCSFLWAVHLIRRRDGRLFDKTDGRVYGRGDMRPGDGCLSRTEFPAAPHVGPKASIAQGEGDRGKAIAVNSPGPRRGAPALGALLSAGGVQRGHRAETTRLAVAESPRGAQAANVPFGRGALRWHFVACHGMLYDVSSVVPLSPPRSVPVDLISPMPGAYHKVLSTPKSVELF